MSINLYNQLFYSKVENAFGKSGLADFFTKIEPVQFAIWQLIVRTINHQTIKVKELGSGTDLTRWQIISELINDKKLEVTLTDFNSNSLPQEKELKRIKNIQLTCEMLDLLKPFPELQQNKKFDVFLATYTFDTVWFPFDAHYEKDGNIWSKTDYDISVPEELKEKGKLDIEDFKRIKTGKTTSRITIEKEPHGQVIADYYKHKNRLKLNFPGGLITKVKEAFETQISADGMFIIGDIAVNSKDGVIPAESKTDKPFYMDDYHASGKVAKFKIEDYGLAKLILEKEGFNVQLATVEDFIKDSGYEIPLHIRDHWIMTVQC